MADPRNTLIRPAARAFYVVLVFEILFMISPAALFFYSVYGPVLGFLDGAPATAWLTQFFLPHIAATGNPPLHAHVAGGSLIVLGLIVFLAGVRRPTGRRSGLRSLFSVSREDRRSSPPG
jgi:hypothetical protein